MIDEERKQIEEHVAHNSQVKSKIIKGGECERSKKMKFNAIENTYHRFSANV
jgi:hypothetical protein